MQVPRVELFPDDESDRAVSPVIGVILMVAITVILAAVIGTFVLNLSGSVSQQASAGVTTENDGSKNANTNVTVTSLGDKTDGIKCVPSGNAAHQVGITISCPDGDSIVAFANGTDSDVENKTIKSNIGG